VTQATAPAPAAASPVDWELAGRVARRIAGPDPYAGSYLAQSLRAEFQVVTAEAEVLVADFTGLGAAGPATATVVDRAAWVDANLASMQRLLAPLLTRVGERTARSPLRPAGRSITGTELGALLGWFSRRVLGQYDLLVPDEAGGNASDAVYLVGPNVVGLERRFGFRPRDFRLWIALHEVTHRMQFTGVPWMRGYFLSLVEESFSIIEPDQGRLVRAFAAAAEELRRGRNPLDEGGIVALLASPEQRGTLARVQALMSVLEGHGNRVMNELGARHVADQARMDAVLRSRRRAGGITGLLHKAVGIESKLRQYEVGEAFVAAVEQVAGPRGLDPVWRGPEWLPSVAELNDPGAWLARVGA
jgi:coenzyme F420 biosynthesis associated uncharacterized protein